MNTFQRMVAIPQDEYMQLSSLPPNPLTQKMTALQHEYQTLPQSSSNAYDHMMRQGSVLEEMKLLKEKISNDISLGTPKPYRNRALSLYRSIEPHINLTQRGEFKVQDRGLENSRIEDLFQHAVRDRRRQFTPVGWKEFLHVLKEYNIPKSALNRATLDELSVSDTPSKRVREKTKRGIVPFKAVTKSKRKSQRKRRPSTRYPDTQFLKDF